MMTGQRGEVLVAIMNKQPEMNIAREQHWYRISADEDRDLDDLQALIG